jgi:hypothetical protein
MLTARAFAGFVHVPLFVKICTSGGVAPPPPPLATLVALVMRPAASIVSAGICALLPYVPGVTPLAGSWAVASVPDVMLLALVVFVVADAANPLICDVLIVGICEVASTPVI